MAPSPAGSMRDLITRVTAAAEAKARATAAALSTEQYPTATEPDGRWETVKAGHWMSGLWPGVLWQVSRHAAVHIATAKRRVCSVRVCSVCSSLIFMFTFPAARRLSSSAAAVNGSLPMQRSHGKMGSPASSAILGRNTTWVSSRLFLWQLRVIKPVCFNCTPRAIHMLSVAHSCSAMTQHDLGASVVCAQCALPVSMWCVFIYLPSIAHSSSASRLITHNRS